MRWLIVGAGSIGLQHLANLREAGEHDLAVLEPNLANRQRAVPFTGHKKAVASWDDAPSCDVALICTPTYRHVEDANTALDHGLHLIIEKPVSHNAEGGEELYKRLGEDKIAMVSCPFRFHPGMVRIKEIVDKQELGEVFFARAWYRQALDEWRPDTDYRQSYSAHRDQGGGLFLDRIHEFDTFRWLFGEPTQVRASIAHTDHFETDIEHTAFAMMTHGNVMTTIGLDCITRGYHCGMEMVGAKGQMGCDFAPTVNGVAQKQGLELGAKTQMAHWIAALSGVDEPVNDLIQAYRTLKLVALAYESARLGTWVPNA